jgi:hypothetical protein
VERRADRAVGPLAIPAAVGEALADQPFDNGRDVDSEISAVGNRAAIDALLDLPRGKFAASKLDLNANMTYYAYYDNRICSERDMMEFNWPVSGEPCTQRMATQFSFSDSRFHGVELVQLRVMRFTHSSALPAPALCGS